MGTALVMEHANALAQMIVSEKDNGYVYQPYLLRTAWRETADKKCSRWWCGN